MEIQILNLYLCCKVKQFICTCKLFCKNPANYQLCIRFHLNFIKRWRRVWRMLSTGKTTFRDRSHSVSAIRTAVYGVGHRLPDAALAARRRCGACFGPRARMVGVSHLLGGGRNAERFRFFRDEALCLIPAVGMSCRRCGQPPDPRFASGRSPAAGRAPSGSPPRSFRHLPFLGAAQPAGTLFFSSNLPPRRRAWVQNFYKWS